MPMQNFYTSVIRHKGSILYRGYKNGERVHEKVKFAPHIFLPDPLGRTTALDGKKVERKDFASIWDTQNYLRERQDIQGFEVYGTQDWVAQYIQQRHPGKIEFDPDLIRIVDVDIEVDSKNGFPKPEEALAPIDCATFKSTHDPIYYVFTLYHGANRDKILKELEGKGIAQEHLNVTYCETEEELLEKLLEWWIEADPDVITGWNIRGFDIPYLINRTGRILGEEAIKLWSPWGIVEQRGVMVKGKELATYDMYGISQLDYLDSFLKFAHSYPPQESYKLKDIANVVLGDTKLSYEEYDSLHDLSVKNPAKYVAYNVIDAQLITRLESKLGILNLIFVMAYKAGVNYTDCFGTTRIWDTLIYRTLDDAGVVVQPNRMARKTSYEGAYVKDPIPGLHSWVMSFDFKSLYPNIIAQYNMSPETIVDERVAGVDVDLCLAGKVSPHSKYAMAANGTLYRKDKVGIIPLLITEYYDERKRIQKLEKDAKQLRETSEVKDPELEKKITRLTNEQMAIKILMNSLYGAMASPYFRHYDIRIAEAITLSGQLAVKWVEKAVNAYLQKSTKKPIDFVVAMDTDSLYVRLEEVVKMANPKDPVEFLDKFGKQVIGPIIDSACTKLHEQMGSYVSRLSMGREVIASRAIWTDKKKRYILRILDDDGVRLKVPKIKIKGMEAVKSSTPTVIRSWMKDFFDVLMTKEESDAHEYIAQKRDVFMTLPVEEIASPIGVGAVDKWMDGDDGLLKGTPKNSRAAVTYNAMLKKTGLDKRYPEIRDGDKMKYIGLKEPNPTKSPVIGFSGFLPPEFNLERYYDLDAQFESTFMKPIRPILRSIGWSDKPKNSFDEFC